MVLIKKRVPTLLYSSSARMLIKCVNGQMMFDEIQSTEKIMSDQIREWEGKEEEMIERTKGIWLGIIETRKEINAIKQRRAAKVW